MPRFLFLLTFGITIGLANGKQVPNFASADLVLGQTDFTSAATPAPPTTSSLKTPSSVVVDAATGRVFVADTGNNRVLRYANAGALINGASAEVVLGQSDFLSSTAKAAAADSLDTPTALWLDAGGHLWVADTGHNRVVMYAGATAQSFASGTSATLILGQPDATTATALNPPTASSLNSPEGLCVDSGGRLWVADKNNNRVLRFDGAAGNATGEASAAADGEFGQDQGTPFTTNVGGSTNLQFNGPTGVAVDSSGILWVADRGNNRIMGFPSAATISNGANGARILGQPDYNAGHNLAGLSASAISSPAGLYVDTANNLWVLDQGNNRAIRFANITSIDNGRPAASVIGQPDFVSSAPDLNAQKLDTQSAAGFASMFVQGDGSLWVSDRNHNRVLRFVTEDSEAPTVAISGKRKVTTKKTKLLIKGTASDDTGISVVSLQIGKKRKVAAGTTAWSFRAKLKPGKNIVTVVATDITGKVSAPAKVVIIRKTAP